MRGLKINVVVSVNYCGDLTPLKMQSIAAKLASPPLAGLAVQVRKRHLEQFSLKLGDGVAVQFPAGEGLRVAL